LIKHRIGRQQVSECKCRAVGENQSWQGFIVKEGCLEHDLDAVKAQLARWEKHFPEYKVIDGKLCYSGSPAPMSPYARLAEAERLLDEVELRVLGDRPWSDDFLLDRVRLFNGTADSASADCKTCGYSHPTDDPGCPDTPVSADGHLLQRASSTVSGVPK
jgi:hypothetical protein